MRKSVFLLIAVLVFSMVFPSNLSISHAMENTNELDPISSYYLVHYNGEEQDIELKEDVILHLTGWTDESQKSVEAYITDSLGDHDSFSIELSEELQELSINEGEKVSYRFSLSPVYKWEVVEPESISEQDKVTENENGTSVKEVRKVDEYGTVHEILSFTYYTLDENNERIEISKEEYDSINPVTEPSVEKDEITEDPSVPSEESTEEAPVQEEMIDENPTEEEESISKVEVINPPIQAQARTFSIQRAILLPSIKYSSHVEGIGWQAPAANGQLSGTSGQGKRLESLRVFLENAPYDGGVTYKTHVQGYGWLTNVSDGAISGTTGESKRMEAVQISLTGKMAEQYDVYYRVHAQDFGWLGWAKNGESAGTESLGKRLEGMEMQLVAKGAAAPGATSNAFIDTPTVIYSTHVQDLGWQPNVVNGMLSGTSGQAKGLEAIKLQIQHSLYSGDIVYSSHVETYGWMNTVSNGALSGTSGQNKRMEAIRINLTGELAQKYDIYYRVHAQDFGWLDWAKNGASAGTEAYSKRLEAIEVRLVKKGTAAPGATGNPFVSKPTINYSTHIQDIGWQGNVIDGAISGTSGQALRIEAIRMNLSNTSYSGNIVYSTHIQGTGWTQSSYNGQQSGSVGSSKRLEAIKISLTGDMANYYDVYYRVHAQDYGWLGWAKNGMEAGTEGFSKRLEAIEIKLVLKGKGSSVNAKTAFIKPSKSVFIDPGHGGKDPGAIAGSVHEADLNLAIAKKVERMLKDRGYTVYMSRTDDTYLTLLDRSKKANELNPDLFISIHQNSSTSTTANGIESYFYKYNPSYPPAINQDKHNDPTRILRSTLLANLVQDKMISYTGARNRGVDSGALAVLRETAVPATLVELGFISNESERAKLLTNSYQDTLAKALVAGIEEYFQKL